MLQLTSQERKVIIFVLCLLILGIGLNFFGKTAKSSPRLDYERLEEQLFKKLDINKATLSELVTIPGVGEKLASDIIDYRKSHAGFETIEELKQIKGIKDKKLEQLRRYITLSNKDNL